MMRIFKNTVVLVLAGLFVGTSTFAEISLQKKKSKKSTPITVVQPKTTLDETKLRNERDPVLAVTPEIPDEISFCGQTIDLRKTDVRERFDREMLAMIYLHSYTMMILKRANRYFPVIEPILKANNIPDDMKYLACIESGLDTRAISVSKAIGMWQFMPETAKQYGMEVSEDVDQRYDFEIETVAACNYLNDSYALYGDWPSAAASYNIGTARITKELAKQGEKSSLNLWLVEQTSRYVFRILACKEFMSHPQKYGYYLKKEQLYMPSVCKDTIVTGKVANWVDFAKSQGIAYYDLKNYNTWIRNDSLVNLEGKSYRVVIPLKESLYFDKKNITVHQKNWVIDGE